MSFLYRARLSPLENLWPKWQFSVVHSTLTVLRERVAFDQGNRTAGSGGKGATRSISMMDILMLALGFGFFALAVGYTYACERL